MLQTIVEAVVVVDRMAGVVATATTVASPDTFRVTVLKLVATLATIGNATLVEIWGISPVTAIKARIVAEAEMKAMMKLTTGDKALYMLTAILNSMCCTKML